MRTITIERFLEQRDVDAALYLLGRMLNLSNDVLGSRRGGLQLLKNKLERSRRISPHERSEIISSYREVIG
jgi:hypothetical protein